MQQSKKITIDLVLRDALLQQGFGFLGQGEAFHRIGLSKLVFDLLLPGGESGADLPAIAPRGSVSDPFRSSTTTL
jgi:hypothetical protein